MPKRKPLLQLIATAVDAPGQMLPGVPLVELAGNQSLILENHCGLIEYSNARIRVKVAPGVITVQGSGLHIGRMEKTQLFIMGTIQEVKLDWREAQ